MRLFNNPKKISSIYHFHGVNSQGCYIINYKSLLINHISLTFKNKFERYYKFDFLILYWYSSKKYKDMILKLTKIYKWT